MINITLGTSHKDPHRVNHEQTCLCDPHIDETWVCTGCNYTYGYCHGSWDENPGLCDDCAHEVTKA